MARKDSKKLRSPSIFLPKIFCHQILSSAENGGKLEMNRSERKLFEIFYENDFLKSLRNISEKRGSDEFGNFTSSFCQTAECRLLGKKCRDTTKCKTCSKLGLRFNHGQTFLGIKSYQDSPGHCLCKKLHQHSAITIKLFRIMFV